MIRSIKYLFLAVLFLAFGARTCVANTQTAKTCNSNDVQNAINAAAEGDTVVIPAGTCTWSSGVAISGKGITVQGLGSGRIIAYSSSTLSIGTGSVTMTVVGTGVTGTPPTPVAPKITNGQTLTISETGNRQNYLIGTVTAFNASTGALTLNVSTTGGSCGNNSSNQSPSNCGRWLVSTIPTTVLVNNSSSAMFTVTEDSKVHTNLSGFQIAKGSGSGAGVTFKAGGGQAILLHDCWIQQGSGDSVWTGVNRGVVWNCSFDATPYSMAPLAVHLQPFDQSAWNIAGYWGALDITGQNNFYVESSDFHAYLNSADNDEGARSVWRYSTFNNAGFGTHGVDTGLIGQRYFEYYNNIGNFDGYANGTTFNMDWWFFVRGGTFIIYNNVLPALNSTDYPNKLDVNMTEMALQRNSGPIPCWGAGSSGGKEYPAPRQVGMGYVTGKGLDGLGLTTYSLSSYGYSGSQYVGDPEPAYIWGNSRTPLNAGTTDYGSNQSDSCGGSNYDVSANYIVANRNYYNGNTPKPGYTQFTYPHPLRTNSGSTGQTVTAPTNLAAIVQ
jgi:hypothetical protein